MKTDIRDRKDIEIIVREFYDKLLENEKVGFFFTVVQKIKLEEHLPIICDFWEGILFQSTKYKRNTMLKHLELSEKHQIEDKHFDEWLRLWNSVISKNYNGPIATRSVSKAAEVAGLMKFKIKTLLQ